MRSKICALAVVAFSASGAAQAAAVYSAGFSLAGDGLRGLSAGNSLDDPNTAYPGSWVYGTNRVSALLDTKDFLGYTVDPVSGTASPTWGNPGHGEGLHNAAVPSFAMGDTTATIYSGFNSTYGTGSASYSRLGTTINMQNDGGQGTGRTTWERQFSLNAHSSFTFSGLATLGITDSLSAPLNASSSFSLSDDHSFASLSLADAADRVRTSISASLFGLTGLGADLFSYATGPNGLLSLTITNNLDTAISGKLSAGSYVNALSLPGTASLPVASPVPEPSTYLTMLLGLGIVGAVARKKRSASAPMPALAGC